MIIRVLEFRWGQNFVGFYRPYKILVFTEWNESSWNLMHKEISPAMIWPCFNSTVLAVGWTVIKTNHGSKRTVRKSVIMCVGDDAGCTLSRWGGSVEKGLDWRSVLRPEPIEFVDGSLWDVRDREEMLPPAFWGVTMNQKKWRFCKSTFGGDAWVDSEKASGCVSLEDWEEIHYGDG